MEKYVEGTRYLVIMCHTKGTITFIKWGLLEAQEPPSNFNGMTMEKGIEMVQRYGPRRRKTRKPPDPEWLQFMSTSEKEAMRQKEWRETSLADTGLSVRVVNCLEEAGILTVDDLTHQTAESLLGITNFGSQTLQQCRRLLANLSLPHYL